MNKEDSLRRNPNRIKVGQYVRTTKAFRDKMGKHLTGKVIAVVRTAKEDLATVTYDKPTRPRKDSFSCGSLSAHFLIQRRKKDLPEVTS
ncbi:hypothetical protein LCGC14_0702400 [marine sediment metagenome]|uniref:Uncharacterized protein n=1 Tax=marine sediment metagenome TaxID=412755 RepID=A0A0F9R2U4_9ZZZZ